MFWKVRRYWERAGVQALPVGLQPEAVNMVLTKLGRGDNFDLFEDLMTIGDGAAAALREQFNRA